MAIFIVLWPYLLTTKLRCLQKNNMGHTNLSDRTKHSETKNTPYISMRCTTWLFLWFLGNIIIYWFRPRYIWLYIYWTVTPLPLSLFASYSFSEVEWHDKKIENVLVHTSFSRDNSWKSQVNFIFLIAKNASELGFFVRFLL